MNISTQQIQKNIPTFINLVNKEFLPYTSVYVLCPKISWCTIKAFQPIFRQDY